jgi:hypothetical protein
MTFKGNRNDIVSAEPTMRKLRVGAKRRVLELNADKGYDSAAFRRSLRKRGTGTNISERKSKYRRKRGRKPHMNKTQFKFRAFVERTNACSSHTGSYATGMNASVVCFRPLLTWSVCGGWEICNEFIAELGELAQDDKQNLQTTLKHLLNL